MASTKRICKRLRKGLEKSPTNKDFVITKAYEKVNTAGTALKPVQTMPVPGHGAQICATSKAMFRTLSDLVHVLRAPQEP